MPVRYFTLKYLVLYFTLALIPHASAHAESRRVISLSPGITELLYAIGAEQQLIATVNYSDYPTEAKALPRIGDVYQIDWEQLLSLQPDLVIAWQGGTPQHVLDRIQSLGLRLAMVEVGKLDSIAGQLRQLGSLTGRVSQAEQAAESYLADLAMLREEYKERAKIRVFYEIDHRPLFTINGQQIISRAITLCGGVNIFSELDVIAPQVSIESVVQREPEVIVYAGPDAEIERVFADWKRWPQLPAVRNHHLYRLNPDLMNRATPRMLQGIKQLCEALDAAREIKK